MEGLALNFQLRERGATLVEATNSAPHYRLHALADGRRPGMLRVAEQGAVIEVEVWAIPHGEVGSFLSGIPAPLGMGKIELEDRRWLTGFICEEYGLLGATDITGYGGWRAWLARNET